LISSLLHDYKGVDQPEQKITNNGFTLQPYPIYDMMGIQNESIVDKNVMYDHFSNIASKYRMIRTTDTKPILHIKNRLNGKTRINIADVGCGDGRYSLELLSQRERVCL